MSSPTVDLCSSESSLSEDATLELASRLTLVREKTSGSKSSASKAHTPDPNLKAREAVGKKSGSSKAGGTSGADDNAEKNGQQNGSQRKKRVRTTPAEDSDTNGRKSATDMSGRESSLWPAADGDGPVQGSLLEEVLAEKRMALMRSPEVIQFLQQRQSVVQTTQQRALLQSQLSPGQVEEDANS